MTKQLPGEDLEIILEEYDVLLLGDVYDIAGKQEKRGNTGLALKIYDYCATRFDVQLNDSPYERIMGSDIYTALGRLYFLKEVYDKAEVALCKAAELNAGNFEAWYWTAEVCVAKGFVQNAKTLFALVAEKSPDDTLIERSKKRLEEIDIPHEIE